MSITFHRCILCAWMILSVWLLLAFPPSVAATEQDDVPVLLVGFAQDHLANDWRLSQVMAIKQGLAGHPGIRFIHTDAGGSTARQIRDIEDLVLSGIDILITSPRDGAAMTPVIQQAYRQGVAILLLNRRIETSDYTTFISADDARIAQDIAHYLADRMHGQGRILILQGVPTASTTQQRTEAFTETLNQYPKMSIAAIKTGNYLRQDAIRAMEEVLAEGLAFDAIYAQSDSMASGARMVLKQVGRKPGDTVIVGIDYIAEARAAILSGEQDASYVYPTGAEEAVQAVLTIAEGNTPPRSILVPSLRVDADNALLIEPIF